MSTDQWAKQSLEGTGIKDDEVSCVRTSDLGQQEIKGVSSLSAQAFNLCSVLFA